jgi:hypothetical protein
MDVISVVFFYSDRFINSLHEGDQRIISYERGRAGHMRLFV